MLKRSAEPIRVLIADDHAILRRGLREIIEETEDIRVVGEAESSAETLKNVRAQRCDVVLLDISMPDRNGIDTLGIIKKEHPGVAVLMLSTYPENQYAIRALRAGASGYLTKQSAPAQLVSAIRQVALGKKFVTPGGRRRARTQRRSGPRPSTPRAALESRVSDDAPDRRRAHGLGNRTAALAQREDRERLPRPHPAEARCDQHGCDRALCDNEQTDRVAAASQ